MSTKEHEEVNRVGGHTFQRKKKKKTDMPNSLLLLDTSMSSTESSDDNCDLTAFFYTNLLGNLRKDINPLT